MEVSERVSIMSLPFLLVDFTTCKIPFDIQGGSNAHGQGSIASCPDGATQDVKLVGVSGNRFCFISSGHISATVWS